MLCPVYSVKYFRDGYYKLIRFNTPRIPCLPTPREAFGDAEKKLSQARYTKYFDSFKVPELKQRDFEKVPELKIPVKRARLFPRLKLRRRR